MPDLTVIIAEVKKRRRPSRVRFILAVESGPSMTREEADAVLRSWVAELVSEGYDVRRWSYIPETPEESS